MKTAGSQHAGLTPLRWAQFSVGRQLLVIANELHHGSHALERGDLEHLRNCYERALRLTQLTAGGGPRLAFLRELLRWRNLLGALYLEPGDPVAHRATLSALLWFHPDTAAQRPFLLT